jgi:hypothetical protein
MTFTVFDCCKPINITEGTMRRSLLVATISLCLLPCLASAQTVDWSTSFLFRIIGGFGFENPLIRVSFDPRDYPPDPVMPTVVDLSEPTMLKLVFPDIAVTNGATRILFAIEDGFSINAMGEPSGGMFEFETFGQGVQNFQFDMSTGSGGIPSPGSWVSFNPQPEPPASFNGTAFDFDFDSFSPATLVIQAFDDGVEPFSFELIQEDCCDPGDLNMNGVVDGYDFLAWQRFPVPSSLALATWENYYGYTSAASASSTVPEPSSFILSVVGLLGMGWRRRQRV